MTFLSTPRKRKSIRTSWLLTRPWIRLRRLVQLSVLNLNVLNLPLFWILKYFGCFVLEICLLAKLASQESSNNCWAAAADLGSDISSNCAATSKQLSDNTSSVYSTETFWVTLWVMYRLLQVLHHINKDKQKTEGQVQIFKIFSDIENCPPHLVSSHRR